VRLFLAASAAGVITGLLRFLSLTGFPNDHFLYLAPAQQMLAGEWPSRDFVDPGTPLMYAASAAARLLVESPLLAEAILVSVAFGIAAAVTLYVAYRASASLGVAVFVTGLEVALFPRSYHYPKLLVYAAGVLAMWSYASVPSRSRAAWLAACVVVAFLFRHDHGVYLGAAGLFTVALAHPRWRDALVRTADAAAMIAALAAPYLLYVHSTAGLVAYVRSGLTYSRQEADRTMLAAPLIDLQTLASTDNARAALFYVFHLLPLAALAAIGWRLAHSRSEAVRADAVRIVPVAVLAIAVNLTLLRQPLQARLPDVAVPACVLAAWLIPRARAFEYPWRVPMRLAVVVAALIALAAVTVVGMPREQLNRTGLLSRPAHLPSLLRERVAELQMPFPRRQLPSRIVEELQPFIEYVRRCTKPEDRLFVAGEAPEIYVFAGRLFAGGQPTVRSGFFDSFADERRVVSRLRRQRVPLALVLTDSDIARYPRILQQLEIQFRPLTELPLEGRPNVLVRVSRHMSPRGVDARSGLPCFQ
jgi:hypothetical protein